MVTDSMPAPEQPAALSPWTRVLGVFFSPRPTFQDIVRKPGWFLPIILSTILAVTSVVALNQRMNWREYIAQQMEKNPRAAQLSAEQKQQQTEMSAKFTVGVVYVAGLVGPVLFTVLIAAVMMGAYNLMAGAGVGFSTAFAIVAYAGLVEIVRTPIFLLVLFLKPYGALDPENPVATNLAAFLPEDSAKWLMALCKSIDIFTIWMLILVAIGFAVVNPRKLKGPTPYIIAFGVWIVFVTIRVGWAFIFS